MSESLTEQLQRYVFDDGPLEETAVMIARAYREGAVAMALLPDDESARARADRLTARSHELIAQGDELARTIIGMERAALTRWGRGDPSGFLEICSEYVTYFDPFQQRRLNGIEELRELYEHLRDQVQVKHFELSAEMVQSVADHLHALVTRQAAPVSWLIGTMATMNHSLPIS